MRIAKTLFDLSEARKARDDAMGRVTKGVDDSWKDLALEAVIRVCDTHHEFIVDDIWAGDLAKPREARAIGPVMLRAERLGYCAKTDRFRSSAQPQCHANPRRIWRSLRTRTDERKST